MLEDAPTDKINTQCRQCGAVSNFYTLNVFNYVADDGCPEEYTLAKCCACDEVSMFYREDVELIWDKIGEMPVFHCLWPHEKYHLNFELPEDIGESYSEAVNALKLGLYKSSAVMIGRALEAACNDYNKKSKSISLGLKKMYEDGALSQELYDWANELRIIRNVGAHSGDIKIEKYEVKSAITFLKSILEIIYDIRPKFREFKDKNKLTLR